MKKLCSVFLAFALGVLFSCSSTDDAPVLYEGDCDFQTLINPTLFENANSDFFVASNPSIEADCLRIEVSSSGCNGENWQIKLVDAGVVLESFPPQRNLRFVFENTEDCEAFITREFSFDVAVLQVDGNQVNLTVEGFQQPIAYSY